MSATQAEEYLTFRLQGTTMEDGRTHVRGDDLPGFYFILEEGEDPEEEMFPVLKDFISRYLKAAARPSLASRQSLFVSHVAPAVHLQDYAVPSPRRAAFYGTVDGAKAESERGFELMAALSS